MNVFTATILSTKKQALATVGAPIGGRFPDHAAYALKVARGDQGDDFTLGIHRVSYPDRQEGKGWGAMYVAKDPHFSQTYTREELVNFLVESGFSPNEAWTPIEDDMEHVKL